MELYDYFINSICLQTQKKLWNSPMKENQKM